MTEMLLQKLEERMMLLLSEVEVLRKEVVTLRQEGSNLRSEKETNSRKLSDLLGLLDAVNVVDQAAANLHVQPASNAPVSLVERRESEYAQST